MFRADEKASWLMMKNVRQSRDLIKSSLNEEDVKAEVELLEMVKNVADATPADSGALWYERTLFFKYLKVPVKAY